ncbi:MAG: hypothetical protein HY873_12095, partial [Chloroflexi bacterium]|nr:hypothetical protein [Chloroflexota bacterium]
SSVGKKKFGYQPEAPQPGALDRLWDNRTFRIVGGAVIVAVFAIIAIAAVTLLGGDELSKSETRLLPPTPSGAAPNLERSAAADTLANKTWDAMSEEERQLVESEVNRVFDAATFRASNEIVLGIDVFRRDGKTLVSRQYQQIETTPGEPALAEQTIVYCPDGESWKPYRYIVTPIQKQMDERTPSQSPRPWNEVVSDIDWSSVTDLGWKDIGGRRAHGFDVRFNFAGGSTGDAQATPGAERRARYWFDVENARLLERGQITEDPDVERQANYSLDYRQPPDLHIPDDLEKPACVQEVLAQVQG